MKRTVTLMFSAMLVLATASTPRPRPTEAPPIPRPPAARLQSPAARADRTWRGPSRGWVGNKFAQQFPSVPLVLSAAHTRAFACNTRKPHATVERRALRKAACPGSAPPAEC